MTVDINVARLEGRIGSIGKMLYFDGGGRVLMVRLATSEPMAQGSRSQEMHTEWHNVRFKDALADKVLDSAMVGQRLATKGRNRTEPYQKDGKKHYMHFLDASEAELGTLPSPRRPRPASKPAVQRYQPQSRGRS